MMSAWTSSIRKSRLVPGCPQAIHHSGSDTMTIVDPFLRPFVGMIDMIAGILGGSDGTFNPGQGMSPPKTGTGTSTTAPTHTASQQVVAAAGHTSSAPHLPQTAQQQAAPGNFIAPGGGGSHGGPGTFKKRVTRGGKGRLR